MADDVRITNMPDAGSNAAVALQLTRLSTNDTAVENTAQLLDRYVECLNATYGQRPVR